MLVLLDEGGEKILFGSNVGDGKCDGVWPKTLMVYIYKAHYLTIDGWRKHDERMQFNCIFRLIKRPRREGK